MDRGFDIPLGGGSNYHGYGGQYTMGRWVKIPWIRGGGGDIPWVGGQNAMGRASKYH